MSFQPVIIGSGLPAWSLLNDTLERQQALHASTYQSKSDTAHFLGKFDKLQTAEDVVSDRRLLRVVLGAYGLADDIDNRHFIKTVLSEGVADSSALANKLSDQRYRSLAKDFDFSTSPPMPSRSPDLAKKTIAAFRIQTFEEAVGETNNNMRLALSFQRSLQDLTSNATSNAAAWYQVMATPPLREVFQTALGLPSSFSNLDIDDQHSRFLTKANDVFGTNDVAELAEKDLSETIVRRFLVLQQSQQVSVANRFETALTLLSAGRA